MQLDNHCTKAGERVMEVLRTKHPDAHPLSAARLDAYHGNPPEMVPVEITGNVVSAVAGCLSGVARPGGTDSVSLQHWLLRFGAASGELRLIIAEVGEWLSNERPSCAVYRAMMSGRLIALNKSPGIRPVGIGETWRHLLAKCLLQVSGQETKAACGTEQLAGGVEAGIEGVIHAARLQWAQNSHEEDFSSLTRGTRSMCRTGQPCYGMSGRVARWRAVHFQLLPQLGHTCGQTHRGQFRSLFAQQGGREPGVPLSHDCIWHRGPPPHPPPPARTSPRHTSVVCGRFGSGWEIWGRHGPLRDQQLRGPARGYFPEPNKSVLVVAERNVPRSTEYFCGMGMQVVTGSR